MRYSSTGRLFLAALSLSLISRPAALQAAETTPLTKSNYELATKWSSQKVGRLVFDTAVTPHWLGNGERFWYTYETSQGRKYWIVDCKAKTKKPLFDSARMASMLTHITLNPYDAQHLPIRTLKFIKNDTAILFEIDLSRDATVRVGDQFKTVQQIGEDAVKNNDMQDKNQDKNKGLNDVKTDDKTKTDGTTEGKTDDKTKTDTTTTTQNTTTQNTTQGTQGTRGGGGSGRFGQRGGGQRGGGAAGAGAGAAVVGNKTLYFEYDLKGEQVKLVEDYKVPARRMTWASLSPDEKTVVFARGHNLYMMDAANYALAQKKADDTNIKETQLTTDGEDHYSFARTLLEENKGAFQAQERGRKDYRVPAIGVSWSKDSKKFSVERQDERKVADLWVINALSLPRPTLETYRYGMPGEENQPQSELLVFDVASHGRVKIKADKFKDQTLGVETDRILSSDREQDKVFSKWLGDSSTMLYFTRASRDRHRVDVCTADTTTGDVKVVIEERLNTYIDTRPLRLVNDDKEILFWSERDGWGHYYLYDASGKLKNQVTSGEFTCEGIAGVDAKDRYVYVTACGREPNEDPYFTHLYRVRLDGKEIKLVNPGDADHTPIMSDDARYFVDNCSRVDAAPLSKLRDGSGAVVSDLETTDISALLDNGFKFPEPFKVKADDGITDLYGVMYKPFDFDPRKRYPVIEYVYPGPQTEAVSKSFSPRSGNMTLAQMGFIVIEVGNRGGSPQRSKWYHNFGYGNLRDYGLADKKRAVEELALKYPWIDIDRVGIYGHSGGGFMSAAAMLVYPDFFKVAFSESGNHENNIYNRWWSETHHGVKETTSADGKTTFSYDIEKNSDLAKNLKGHLMLVTGDIDNNVHPANTIRLANALIRANKRFDYFQFPGQRHAYGNMTDYCFWLRADYFCKHLLGDYQSTVDILPLDREQPQSGDRRVRAPGMTEDTDDTDDPQREGDMDGR